MGNMSYGARYLSSSLHGLLAVYMATQAVVVRISTGHWEV